VYLYWTVFGVVRLIYRFMLTSMLQMFLQRDRVPDRALWNAKSDRWWKL